LAFYTYEKDMSFNAPSNHKLLYPNETALWRAVHRAHAGLAKPGSEWSQMHRACASIGFEQIDVWQAPSRTTPGAIPESSNFAAEAELGESESEDLDKSSSSEEEDEGSDSSEGESEGSGESPRARSSNKSAGRSPQTEQQRKRAEALNELDNEFDPEWEVEPEHREVVDQLKEVGGESEEEKGQRLCSLYERLAYLKGVTAARDGFTEKMDSLGALIS
jgi:hypothetical protein